MTEDFIKQYSKYILEKNKNYAMKVVDNHHCPNCGEALPCKGITNEYCSCCFNWKYCPECGQKLDWGDKQ